MSFLFPLADIATPAPANTIFPEQATTSIPATAGLNGAVVFPQLFAALSEAEAHPLSPDSTDGMSPAAAEMAPFTLLPRPAVRSGRHDVGGRLAKANHELNDAVICPARYNLPWAGACHGMELEFGSSLSLPISPSQPERTEEVVSEDSDTPDFQIVTLPAGFFPVEPSLEKPPVSADAFVEAWTVEEEPSAGEEPQRAATRFMLPAAESENAIPIRHGTETNVAQESPPTVPRPESTMLIPPLPVAAENRTEGIAPSSESVSSSLQSVASSEDTRSQTLDGRQSDPAIAKVSLSDRTDPVTREAFRILLRENTAPVVDFRAAAPPVAVREATRQAVALGPSDQDLNGAVQPSPAPAQKSSALTRPVGSHATARSQQTTPETTLFSKAPIPFAKSAVPGLAEASETRIELSVRGSQGGSTNNGEAKHSEQANSMVEKPELGGGKPVLSREQLALLVHSRPTAEPFNVKPVSEHAASTTVVEEPIGFHPGPNPVRQLRVSLPPSEAGGGVQLLVQQRPGGVEVSVHSPNQSVRETLRSSLSELIGSLDRKGVVTEALPSTPAVAASFGERADSGGASTTPEIREGDKGDDPKNRQDRSPQWESGGDNRRRRNPDADAWKKYLEEYAWRNQ